MKIKNRLKEALLAASMGILLACANCAMADSDPLLKNSSFKEGMETWRVAGNVKLIPENGPDGGGVLRFSGVPLKTQLISEMLAVEPGKDYVVALWARADSAGEGGALMRFFDPAQKAIAGTDQRVGLTETNGDWEGLEMKVTVPVGAAYGMLIIFGGSNGQGHFDASNPKVYPEEN